MNAPDEQQEPAEVEQLDDERSILVARAWHLHIVEGHPITYVAERLGVSRATAWRYAREGKAQAAFMPYMQREEQRLGHTVALRAMRSWLYQDAEATGGTALEYVPVLLKVLEAERKLHGLDAPSRLALSGQVGGPTPNPDVIAAIQATIEERMEGPSS